MSKVMLAQLTPIMRELLDKEGEVHLRPTGNSMWPIIRHDIDEVVLVRCDKIKKQGIYLFERDAGQMVLHRCIGYKNGGYIFRGDNQSKIDRNIQRENILAQAKFIIRGKYRIRCNTLFFYVASYFIPLAVAVRKLFRN